MSFCVQRSECEPPKRVTTVLSTLSSLDKDYEVWDSRSCLSCGLLLNTKFYAPLSLILPYRPVVRRSSPFYLFFEGLSGVSVFVFLVVSLFIGHSFQKDIVFVDSRKMNLGEDLT